MPFNSLPFSSGVRRFVRPVVRVSGVLVLLVGILFVPARTAHAGPPITMAVNTTADTVDASPGNGVCADSGGNCSLRAAIMEANADPGSTIQFAPALNGTPIMLTRVGNDYTANSGDLDINANMTISGNGTSNTIIQAAADASYTNSIQDKVFGVNQSGFYPNLTVSFSGLTIRYGDNNIPTSDPDYAYTGGGVDVYFTGSGNSTTFTNCVISYNRSRTSYGGGLNVDSTATGTNTLTLTNVTFSNNRTMSTTSTSHGGALNVFGNNVTVNISNSTFTNNTVPTGARYGGAISSRPNSGSLTIDRTVFTGNSAWYGGAIYALSQPVTITYSRFVGNTATGGGGIYVEGSSVTAENNWWGCSTGPSAAPCDSAILLSGSLDYTPWLRDQLTVVPDPLALVTNQTAALTASFLTNSGGETVSIADLAQLIGQSVSWGATSGTLSGQQTTIQSAGTGTATFHAGSPGSTVIHAKVDNDSTTTGSNVLSRTITINKANTTTAITSHTPDPSAPGESVTVSYTVSGAYGNSPTAPTGNVTVSDGIDSCTGTVAAGSCTITLTTVGARTLTATYAEGTNFNGSTSSGTDHTVSRNSTTTAITSDTPDPSVLGQVVNFGYSVYVVPPGEGAPTGEVPVSNGTDSCSGTVAAGSCNVALTTTGSSSFTATYAGDTTFAGSSSVVEQHTVNGPPEVTRINSVADTGDGQLLESEHTRVAITQLLAVFSKSMNSLDAETAGNYHLYQDGSPVDLISDATYNNGTFTTTLNINSGLPLPHGTYTLTVSGSMRDTLGAPIGTDFVRHFVIDRYFIYLPMVVR